MIDPSVVGESLQRQLDALTRRRGVVHAVLAVERQDGSFRWTGAAGDADGRGTSMQADTPFFAASITKMYTATTVLRLHERGLIDLDASMLTYLPPSLADGLHRWRDTDRTREITVRHLLGHTSGLASYFEDRPKGGRSRAEEMFRDGDRGWDISEVCAIVRDRLKPHFAPGSGIRYSDTNYALLGAVLEAVAGRPLHAIFAEELLDPLGLRDTYLAGHPPKENGRPPASLFFDGQPLDRPRAMESVGAQGGLVTTCPEAITFLRALFDGQLFADPSTLSLVTSGWRRFGLPLDRAALRAPSWPIEYSLGFMRFQLPRALYGMRRMPSLLGHSGSSGSWLFMAPERQLFFVGTVDEVTSGAVPYRLLPRLLRVMEKLSLRPR
jgi:D-alanyl-D-alanine carboxypeptidase